MAGLKDINYSQANIAGTGIPVQIQDLQQLWEAFDAFATSVDATTPRIISGFEDTSTGGLTGGIIAFNNKAYYLPNGKITSQFNRHLYVNSVENSQSQRVAENGQIFNFYKDRVVNTGANGSISGLGTYIGEATAANVKAWKGSFSLDNGSVTTPVLADGAVTTAKLANNSVTNPIIADGAVSNSKIAYGAVNNIKIADGTITATKLSDNFPYSLFFVDPVTKNRIYKFALYGRPINDPDSTTSGVLNLHYAGPDFLSINTTSWQITTNSSGNYFQCNIYLRWAALTRPYKLFISGTLNTNNYPLSVTGEQDSFLRVYVSNPDVSNPNHIVGFFSKYPNTTLIAQSDILIEGYIVDATLT